MGNIGSLAESVCAVVREGHETDEAEIPPRFGAHQIKQVLVRLLQGQPPDQRGEGLLRWLSGEMFTRGERSVLADGWHAALKDRLDVNLAVVDSGMDELVGVPGVPHFDVCVVHKLGKEVEWLLEQSLDGLAVALMAAPALRRVNLSGLALLDEGLCAVARVVAQHAALAELIVARCELHDGGVEALARAIESNTHCALEVLVLNGNSGVGDAGAIAVARALQRNRTIHTVLLHGCAIGDAGARGLLNGLRGNRTVHTVVLASARLTPAIAPLFITRYGSDAVLVRDGGRCIVLNRRGGASGGAGAPPRSPTSTSSSAPATPEPASPSARVGTE